MKTTIELPDELYRRAKAQAALDGRKLKDLVEDGLRRLLDKPKAEQQEPTLAELMRDACGVVDSGIPDLSTNPEHMAGFGRDGRRDP